MEKLSRQNFLTEKFSLINLINIMFLHIFIILFFIFLEYNTINSITYFLFGWVVCSVHQRQVSEWLHEGIHFNIHKNKIINDFVSKYFLGYLMGIPLNSIRKNHFNHHAQKDFFGPDDDDTAYAKFSNTRHLLLSVFLDLIGFNAIKNYLVAFFKTSGEKNVKVVGNSFFKNFLPIIILQISLIIFFVSIGKFYLYILYYFSLISLYPLLSRIRVYGQHLHLIKMVHLLLKKVVFLGLKAHFGKNII